MTAAAGQRLSDFGIGASEISSVVGLNPYRSRHELWEEKVGERAPFDGNEATEWGLLTEPAIRKAYELKTGARLIVPPGSLFHPEIPFARATPDAIVVNDNAPAMVPGFENHVPARWWAHLLQLKNTGYWPGKAWDQGPPDWVVLQEQWEMFVVSAQPDAPPIDRADVAACIGGGFPHFFTVHRDEKIVSDLVKAAHAFWRLVETRTPPDVDDSEACRSYWLRRARAGAELVVPYADAKDVADEYMRAWGDARRADRRLEAAKTAVARLCGEAAAGGVEAGDGSTIKLQARAGQRKTDWEHVARLCAQRAGMSSDELAALVAENTRTGAPSTAVVAPRAWGKES